MIIPLLLSRSLRSFLCSSSVYSCHLFSISPASVRPIIISICYCAHLYMKFCLDISNFLKEIFSLSHCIFPSISFHCSFKAFLFILARLWNSALRWVYPSFSPLPFTFSSFLSYLTVWITTNCGKYFKRCKYETTLLIS